MSNVARYDDLNTKTIGYLTLMSALLLIVIILLLQALCYNWIEWQEEDNLSKKSYPSSDEVVAKQLDSLKSYGTRQEVVIEQPAAGTTVPDGQKAPPATGNPAAEKTVTRIQIPIKEAGERVLSELKQAAKGEKPKT